MVKEVGRDDHLVQVDKFSEINWTVDNIPGTVPLSES